MKYPPKKQNKYILNKIQKQNLKFKLKKSKRKINKRNNKKFKKIINEILKSQMIALTTKDFHNLIFRIKIQRIYKLN